MSPYSYTVNCSILLTHLPLLERPHAVRDAGFNAVEFWWPFDCAVPGDREVDEFVRAVSNAGVTLSHLNFAAGNLADGDRGLLSDPQRISEFRDNIEVVVGIGEQLGAAGFNALYGNRVDGVAPEMQDELATENLVLAAEAAARIGACVLLEPVSGFPAYPLQLARDAVEVIERVGRANIGLLADLYHLAVNGEDIPTAITRFSNYIRHVQIADVPGRGAPGTGDLPLTDYLSQICETGYDGYVSLEYVSAASDPFSWLARDGFAG
ncbi:hydroxypyruvate isomerase family protein [Hoyosella altamirensis]|uniref:Hydroxypyruvate isomerase n=1 Tax=Hoyosella altamirensis TaxID=616997 RepID=A0A839RKY5_9ACTN|nr:TIM barrel protein [Hoyosella altamirensis]MBB3037355.1 hydroxypyruvate isomerase [Hoyosella altamirensis]